MQPRWPRTLSALSALSLVSALSSVTPLAAQDDDARVFTFSGRPRIGVTVDSRADRDRDKLGARLQAVTPDGPADKAGLKAGDVITRFNGVSLGGIKGDDEDESGPAQKLVELARKLDAGDTVNVEYRRDGEAKKAKVVAQDLSGMGMGHGFRMEMPHVGVPHMELEPGLPRMPMGEVGPGNFRVFVDGDFGGLNLADLNPELGEYFGAKEGVLVLETPEDSTLPLKAGDVILAIDGRAPASEAHARRILRSYETGETAKIEIFRKQKKLTVSWKVPERQWKWKTPGPRSKVKVERS